MNSFLLRIIQIAFVVSCLLAAPLTGAETNCEGQLHPAINLDRVSQGADIPRVLGRRMADLARFHKREATALNSICERNGSLRISKAGHLHYACNGLAVKAGTVATTTTTAAAAPFPLTQTFALHSRPGASKVIYLNFTGHKTTGTWWNSDNSVASIVTPPYDLDGNPSSFSNTELSNIQEIWQRVAEDYFPFEVDVTTEDPGTDGIVKSGSGDQKYGIRVCIGGSSKDWFGGGAGGVTYLDSFGMSTDTPAFVFPKDLGNGFPKYVAEAVSHETGHSFGLDHQGQTNGTEYYAGQGNWAPIMGVGYDRTVVQWSQGEYPLANNKEDEMAKIAAYVPYRADQSGGDILHAQMLTGSSFNAGGVIERRTDVDVFGFTTGAGKVSFTIAGAAPSPNLNAQLSLYDGSGKLITTANPGTNLGASLTATVPQGTYYLAVDGVSSGSPTSGGYSDYGSVGQFTLTGTAVPVTGSNQPPVAVATSSAPLSGTVPLTVNFSSNGSHDPDGSIVRYDWNFGDGGVSDLANPAYTYTKEGTYTPTLVVYDNGGLSSTTKLSVEVKPVVVTTKSVHVAEIKLGLYYYWRYGYYVYASVVVKDQNGVAVPNAIVQGTWSGLATNTATAKTNRRGVASLASYPFRTAGTITFTTTGITLSGYGYAADQNAVTQASLTIPSAIGRR